MKPQRLVVAVLVGSGILAAALITALAPAPALAASPGLDFQPTGAGNAFKFRVEPTGPSFNCNYAKAPDEVIICQNRELSSKDREMARIYFFLINNASAISHRHFLRSTQATWLNERRRCGYDADCVSNAYERRLPALYELAECRRMKTLMLKKEVSNA